MKKRGATKLHFSYKDSSTSSGLPSESDLSDRGTLSLITSPVKRSRASKRKTASPGHKPSPQERIPTPPRRSKPSTKSSIRGVKRKSRTPASSPTKFDHMVSFSRKFERMVLRLGNKAITNSCIILPPKLQSFTHKLLTHQHIFGDVAGNDRALQYEDMDRQERDALVALIIEEMATAGIKGILTCPQSTGGRYKLQYVSSWKVPMREKIMARLKHNYKKKHGSGKCEDTKSRKTSANMGSTLIETFEYGDVPWKVFGNKVLKPDESTHKTRGQATINGATAFAGNFSVLMPQGSSFRIGVAHGTHRFWTEETDSEDIKCHLGGVTLVEVPENCMIIFHAFLFHYGDRAMYEHFKFQRNYRLFAYLKDSQVVLPTISQTHHAIMQFWCDESCDVCGDIHKKLKDDFCSGSDDMVWRFPKNTYDLEDLDPGHVVMGDIPTLGWAVIKCFQYSDPKDITSYNNQMASLDRQVKTWKPIQAKKDNDVQFPCFNKTGDMPMFEKRGGKRRMMVSNPSESLDKIHQYPKIELLFSKNLFLCNIYLNRVTHCRCDYHFFAHNILANDKDVCEQYIHTDYSPNKHLELLD